jgi:hypothetical protein
MGTRNLTCIVKNGEYKIAKYGQWDGYLNGVGRDLLEVMQSIIKEDKVEKLVQKIDSVREVTEDELRACILSCGGKDDSQYGLLLTMDTSETYKNNFPSLHRDTSGSDLIKLILEANETLLVNKDLEFAADSLFCEWCYVIDLDKKTFEVYKGFNKDPLQEDERFYFMNEHVRSEYQPVRFFASLSFDDLSNRKVVDILEEFEQKKEREED